MTITVNSASGVDWTASGIDQIKNNVLNILRTRKGEVPYMPEFGLNPDYIGTPLTQARAALIADVREQLKTYEPSATLDSLTVVPDENGDYSIEVVVTI